MQNIMYIDLMRKFPVVSSQGNRYFMVLCEKDGNLILVEPMKTRSLGEMCRAYSKLMMCLTKMGIKVSKHILNNEASDKYLQAIKCNGILHEKVPPKYTEET